MLDEGHRDQFGHVGPSGSEPVVEGVEDTAQVRVGRILDRDPFRPELDVGHQKVRQDFAFLFFQVLGQDRQQHRVQAHQGSQERDRLSGHVWSLTAVPTERPMGGA